MTEYKVGDRVRYEVEGDVLLVYGGFVDIAVETGRVHTVERKCLTKIEPPRKTFAEQVEALDFGTVFWVGAVKCVYIGEGGYASASGMTFLAKRSCQAWDITLTDPNGEKA